MALLILASKEVGIPVLYNLQLRSSCSSATCCCRFFLRSRMNSLRDDSKSKLNHHTYHNSSSESQASVEKFSSRHVQRLLSNSPLSRQSRGQMCAGPRRVPSITSRTHHKFKLSLNSNLNLNLNFIIKFNIKFKFNLNLI